MSEERTCKNCINYKNPFNVNVKGTCKVRTWWEASEQKGKRILDPVSEVFYCRMWTDKNKRKGNIRSPLLYAIVKNIYKRAFNKNGIRISRAQFSEIEYAILTEEGKA